MSTVHHRCPSELSRTPRAAALSTEASELRPRLRCALVTALGGEHGQSSTSHAAAASVLASSATSPRLAFWPSLAFASIAIASIAIAPLSHRISRRISRLATVRPRESRRGGAGRARGAQDVRVAWAAPALVRVRARVGARVTVRARARVTVKARARVRVRVRVRARVSSCRAVARRAGEGAPPCPFYPPCPLRAARSPPFGCGHLRCLPAP